MTETQSPVIKVDNLQKIFSVPIKEQGLKSSLTALFHRRYKEIKAVDGISFSIEPGEMIGFLGPNGAGKTTTLKMLSGILYPTSGHIDVLGYKPQNREKQFQKQIALVMGQKNQLWWDLPPTDTFLLNKDIYEISDATYKKTVSKLIEILEVQDILTTQVRKLSLGQRMKCELIASLLHQPKVLFLDEPTIGLDIVIQKKVRQFLKEINKEFNTTIILTSHYMDDVKEVCKRIVMIDHGHKVYDGSLASMISTYADEKYIHAEFEDTVHKKDLESIGKIIEFDGLQAVISVPRETHAQKAAELLTKFSVTNLDSKEVELEDVIIKFFNSK